MKRAAVMWALVSPNGHYLVAFRTLPSAAEERLRFRPETRIQKIAIKPIERARTAKRRTGK